MGSLVLNGIFLLLLICSNTCLHAQDKCDEYSEDWKCPTDNTVKSPRTNNEDLKKCTEGFVGETRQLIEEGLKLVNYTEVGKAVMVIGLSGTGKSTFVYFLAGDESKLIAYSPSLEDYKIKDCNKKIGDGLASKTIFPDLVQDPATNIAYYDNPGFSDNRSPCIEVANAFFMTDVTSKLSKVKFVITLSYDDLASKHRTSIPQTLKSVLGFIPNLQKFKYSFTLAATKLDSDKYADDRWVDETVKHLESIKSELGSLDLTQEEQNSVRAMLDGIIDTKSIVVFRVPNECGPLSEIPLMQANKLSMAETMRNVSFTSCEKGDFNLTLSGGTKSKVKDIAAALYPEIKVKLADVMSKISKTWAENLTSIQDIFERQLAIEDMSNNATLIVSNLTDDYNSATTFKTFFESVNNTLVTNVPMFKAQVEAFYENYSTTVEFLEFLLEADAGINWRVFEWRSTFSSLKTGIEIENNFISIMIYLYGELSSVDNHADDYKGYKEWYKTYRFTAPNETLEIFWTKFKEIIPLGKDQFRNTFSVNPEAKLATLNSLLATTLGSPFQCARVDSNGVAVYSDMYLNFKNIFSINCAHVGLSLKTVVVLAYDTVFADANFVSMSSSTGDGVNVIVISPRMPIEKQNVFLDLRGHNAKTAYPPQCCGNTPGVNGEDGKKGGAFYGVTGDMKSQFALSVDCSGGTGADGQAGQEGIPGSKGSTQHITSRNNDDCAAWRGGTIQIRKYPNSCNGQGGLTDVCNAGDGSNYDIYGTRGQAGGPGGAGGIRGSGGARGMCSLVCSNCLGRYNLASENGKDGTNGNSGSIGSEGKCGDTAVYKIYGYYHAGRVEYLCWAELQTLREHRDEEPCQGWHFRRVDHLNDQNQLTNPLNNSTLFSNHQHILNEVDIEQYKLRFQEEAQKYYNNEFMGKKLKQFVERFLT